VTGIRSKLQEQSIRNRAIRESIGRQLKAIYRHSDDALPDHLQVLLRQIAGEKSKNGAHSICRPETS